MGELRWVLCSRYVKAETQLSASLESYLEALLLRLVKRLAEFSSCNCRTEISVSILVVSCRLFVLSPHSLAGGP